MSQNTTDQMMMDAEIAFEEAFRGQDEGELSEEELREVEKEVEEGLQAFLNESWEHAEEEEQVGEAESVPVNAQKPGASERIRKRHMDDVARGKRRAKRTLQARASAAWLISTNDEHLKRGSALLKKSTVRFLRVFLLQNTTEDRQYTARAKSIIDLAKATTKRLEMKR